MADATPSRANALNANKRQRPKMAEDARWHAGIGDTGGTPKIRWARQRGWR
jgi:hypothetical protein